VGGSPITTDIQRISLEALQLDSSAQAFIIETPGICNQTFRGTGTTAYLENLEAQLKHAQQLAAHSDGKTTWLYDRRNGQVLMDEVERTKI